MFRQTCTLLVVVAVGVLNATAQESQADTTYVLPGITIVDDRPPFYENDTAAHVTRISASDLEMCDDRTVGAVLGQLSGAFIRQYGVGGSAGVTLRGTGTGQTAVLLDGIPVENPQLGQIDLSLLPVSMLSGIEVLHGGASSLVGSGAIGGAISLRSLGADDQEGARIATSVGAWGERMVAGRVTAGRSRVRAVLAAEAFTREGNFPYTDRWSLPEAQRLRENADGSAHNIFGKLVVAGARSITELAAWVTDADRGLPGLAGSGPNDERQTDRIGRVWIRHATGGTTLNASAQWSRLTYVSPAWAVSDTGRTATASVGLTRTQSFGRRIQADLGTELTVGSASHPSLGSDSERYGVKAFVIGRVDRGSVRAFPSLRGDWFVGSGLSMGRLSPGLRLRIDRPLQWPVAVKAGALTSFRAPTFNDLYWRGQGAVGNDHLSPEKGFSADLGVEAMLAGFQAEVSAFLQMVRNQITWAVGEAGLWRPENIGRVRTLGVETGAYRFIRISRTTGMSLRLHYTFTDARDRTDRTLSSFDKPLRHVPAHVLNADFLTEWKSLEVGMTVRRSGRRYLTVDATESLPPHTVVDSRVAARLLTDFGRVDVTLFVENLGGSEYQVMSGYPMPPRNARFQISLTLR